MHSRTASSPGEHEADPKVLLVRRESSEATLEHSWRRFAAGEQPYRPLYHRQASFRVRFASNLDVVHLAVRLWSEEYARHRDVGRRTVDVEYGGRANFCTYAA